MGEPQTCYRWICLQLSGERCGFAHAGVKSKNQLDQFLSIFQRHSIQRKHIQKEKKISWLPN